VLPSATVTRWCWPSLAAFSAVAFAPCSATAVVSTVALSVAVESDVAMPPCEIEVATAVACNPAKAPPQPTYS
jgi:hypothetical protein